MLTVSYLARSEAIVPSVFSTRFDAECLDDITTKLSLLEPTPSLPLPVRIPFPHPIPHPFPIPVRSKNLPSRHKQNRFEEPETLADGLLLS